MKILMVVANFKPEIGSAAHIYHDLAKAFVAKGHDVDVITSYPREFYLEVKDRGRTFPLHEKTDGYTVHRCMHPADRDNILVRGLEHYYLSYYYYRTFRRIDKDFDVALFYIPPLPLYYLANKLRKKRGIPYVLNFQDFHPQELTDVGVLKNPLMIWLLEHLERKAYSNADHITVLSNAGKEYIHRRGGDDRQITHIYNSASISDFDHLIANKDMKTVLGVEGKFMVSYAGIMSPYQGLDAILNTAAGLKDRDDIVFVMAGDGSEKKRLKERMDREGLGNMLMLELLPREKYFNLINSSDVSFVSLDERMRAPCLPGKTINLMACSQPILAMVAEDSATADLIRESECGLVLKPDDVSSIGDAIIEMKQDEEARMRMGANGRSYLEKNMNLNKNVSLYESIFQNLMEHER